MTEPSMTSKSMTSKVYYRLASLCLRACSTHEHVLLIYLVILPITWNCRVFSFILWSGMLYVRALTIYLLLVYFVSAAGCHCFDSYHQCPWVISSFPMRICGTSESYPQYLWGYDSRVPMIWLTGTAYPHWYWGYDWRVLRIWLMGNAYPHRYCTPSRVLHIVYTEWLPNKSTAWLK